MAKKWVILFFLFFSAGANLEARTVAGKVIAVEGNVTASEAASAARKLIRGSVFYVGDTVEVAEGGKIQLRFTDGTLANLAEVTQFVVHEYVFKHKRDTDQLSTELLVGGCRMLTGSIAKERPKDFTIKTPVATIGVLGTYLVISFREGKLEVACTEGTAYIENEKGIVTIGVGQPTQYATVGTQGGGAQTSSGGGTTTSSSSTTTSSTSTTTETTSTEASAPQAAATAPEGIAEVTEDTQMPGAFPIAPAETTGKVFIQGGC